MPTEDRGAENNPQLAQAGVVKADLRPAGCHDATGTITGLIGNDGKVRDDIPCMLYPNALQTCNVVELAKWHKSLAGSQVKKEIAVNKEIPVNSDAGGV